VRTVPLRHFAEVRTSSVDKHSHDDEQPVQLCNYVDVYKNDLVAPHADLMRATASAEEIARFRLQVGDSVLTKDSEDPSDIGISAHVVATSPDFVCGYHLAIARPTAGTHPRYLTWALRSRPVLDHFSIHASGISRYGLTTSGLRAAPIPAHPEETQQRIADFLDDRVARIEQIIAARELQRRVLAQSTSSRLQEMQDAWAERHGETRLGRVLLGLEQGWSPQAESTPAAPDEWGVMRSGCVNEGIFRESDNKRLPDILDPRKEYELRPGDLLVSRASGSLDKIGSAAVVPSGVRGRLLLCDKIYRLTPLRGWDPHFIAPMLRTHRNRELIRLGVSGAEGMANNLPSGVIRGLTVPLVPQAQQASFAGSMANLEKRSRVADEALMRSMSLLQEYKQSLITAAVTGELDVVTAGSGIPG